MMSNEVPELNSIDTRRISVLIMKGIRKRV